MKNWKTTLAGLVTGLPFLIDAVMQAYTAGYFTDQKGWQLFGSIAWIVVTALVKDHDKDNNSDAQSILGTDRPDDRP